MAHIERKPVVSTNIASIGYDKDALVLEVEFRKGGIYRYNDVTFGEYNALMTAESQGRYFAQFIRGKTSEKVD
jgi:hypothetical protein